MQKKLPGLNGLRAIAASFVLISHVFQISGDAGDGAAAVFFGQHKLLGKDMVNLFFVISGFIITWLLLQERTRTGSISLRKFYIKRILRIWPLYFGILAVVFLLNRYTQVYDLYPPMNGIGLLVLSLFVLNIRDALADPQVSVLQHYWSLSIEEQFYIFWPPVFRFLKEKAILFVSIAIIVVMAAGRNAIAWAYNAHPNEYLLSTLSFFINSLFGSIAIGILGAWILFRAHPFIRILFHPALQIISWTVLFCLIIYPFYIPYVHFEVTGFFYLVLILNVAANPETIWKVENKFLDKTGDISYGLYMFHWPIIPIVILAVKKAGCWDFFIRTYQIPLVLICYGLTWLIAYISFRYFESWFLKFRVRY